MEELSDDIKDEIEDIAERAGLTTRWQDAGRLVTGLAFITWILYKLNKSRGGGPGDA